MITFNKAITVVCRMNQQGDINPFKFRLKEAGFEARTCYISSVNEVRYGKIKGEEVITYQCMAELDQDQVSCSIHYLISDGTWRLYQMNTTIGIAI